MWARKVGNYICSAIIMIIFLLLFKVTDTFIKSFQVVIITYVGTGIINLITYLMTNIIRKIRK